MNHVAFSVPPEIIEHYWDRLRVAGVDCTEVANHDDSEFGLSEEVHAGTFIRSIYFQDPDGILLEFACWTRPLGPGDVRHDPARAMPVAKV
jgi:catechol 2,3-dioxygenase-like lactoylglutathione lyase family enzyme